MELKSTDLLKVLKLKTLLRCSKFMMFFPGWSTVPFFDNRRDRLFNLGRFFLVRPLIQNLEGLLAYAVKTGDKAEEDRIRRELVALVEELE